MKYEVVVSVFLQSLATCHSNIMERRRRKGKSKEESQQITFEKLVRWCGKMYTGLPLTFLLGFYVSLVVKRWWEQYCFLPWPDSLAFYLRGLVTGGDKDQNIIIRRSVVRYCLLSYILCIRRLSARLRKRFPTTQEIIRTGIMRPDEAARMKGYYFQNLIYPRLTT